MATWPQRLRRGALRRSAEFLRRRSGRLAMALRPSAQVLVSIVVPTHDSDQAGLERLFGSLDAQSMPSRNYEVIVVDDGSTDDTLARLRRLARDRPHVTVTSIPNSGWPSRPRNVGVRMARGEYVLFMDHDDELFPEALERAHAYGRRHDADIVNAKEVRTTFWTWGWAEFGQNRTPERPGPIPAMPMTPHKLYRRDFLRRHGIRFREGGRVLWEDIHFNVACLAAEARVAVLADYPFYHWVATEANNSSTFGRDVSELWDHLTLLMEGIDEALADNRWRRPLLTHQARGRLLDALGPRLLRWPEHERDVVRARARALLDRYLPEVEWAMLTPVDRARIDVLRRGDTAAQVALAESDRGVRAVTRVEDVAWQDGLFVVRVTATLGGGDGNPVAFRRAGDRWLRELPPSLAELVSPQAADLTAALAEARLTVIARGRRSRSIWPVPTLSEVTMLDNGDGTASVTARGEARFDIGPTPERTFDDETVWDFGARLEAAGYTTHGHLMGGRPAVALTRGRAAIAYKNRDGRLSLDVSNAVRTVVGSARPRPEDVTVAAVSSHGVVPVTLAALLPQVHCSGDMRLIGEVLLDAQRLPAVLAAEDGRAFLRAAGDVAPGDYRVRARFNGRTGDTGLVLTVHDGTAEVRAG